MSEKKSDKLSEQYRNEGNLYYAKKEHFNAIVSYNKSLCYAVSKENLAFAYANRSAMYFELKKYKKCLENIKWARESDYPAEKVQKLDEREEKCKKMMEIDTEFDARSFFKFSYPANPKIPFIAKCLEVRTTEEFGRGIYTKQDLKPGDIIAFDKPVFHTVNNTSQYVCCCNCLKYQMQSLIPCLKTASLMFCTVECRDKAYALYPDISCMFAESEIEHAFPIQITRLLAQAENTFNGHENLMKYLKTNECKKAKETVFDYDFSDPNDPSYEMNRMKAALSLMSHVHNDYKAEVQNVCKKVAKGDKCLEEFLNHVCGVFIKNMHPYKLSQMEVQQTHTVVHLTLPLGSLFNHSCFANVSYFNNNEVVVFHVNRPVKAGEQLFMNYYGVQLDDSLLARQRLFQGYYHFVCRCVKCVKNITLHETLSRGSEAFHMACVQSIRFTSFQPLISYKDLSVEIFKQLKENQELINKNADDPCSPEVFVLPDFNDGIFRTLGVMTNFPCFFKEILF